MVKKCQENCGLVMSKNTNIDKTYIRYSSWIWLLLLFLFTLTGTRKKPLLIYSTRHDLNMCISQCLEISFLFFLLLILTLCIFTLLQLTCSYMFWIKHFWLTFFKTVWLTPAPLPTQMFLDSINLWSPLSLVSPLKTKSNLGLFVNCFWEKSRRVS